MALPPVPSGIVVRPRGAVVELPRIPLIRDCDAARAGRFDTVTGRLIYSVYGLEQV